MRTSWIPLCLIAASIASTGYAQQHDTTFTPAEVQVMNKLHAANVKEIAAGKYAASHARSDVVKRYGEELQEHHSQADTKLQALASRAGVKLSEPPPNVDSKNLKKEANPATFDRPFLIQMINAHDEALHQVHEAQSTAVNPELQTMLKNEQPALQHHRDQAARLLENTL